ncbi:MAG: hypothetical protein ACYTG6_11435 [Planctomycetota bacterium]|jgi:uncharacterized membrane protein
MMPVWCQLFPAATETRVGELKWADLPPAWILVLTTLVLLAFLRGLYQRERGRASTPLRFGLAALRTLILLLLILVLAGPYREVISTTEERSHLVLLLDTSASMGTADTYEPAEGGRLIEAAWPEGGAPGGEGPLEVGRMELVQRVLAPEDHALLKELDRRFILHVFAFDREWRSLGSGRERAGARPDEEEVEWQDARVEEIAVAIRGVEPEGPSTRLGQVLRNVAGEFLGREDRRLAGVLLFSDGRDTSEGEPPLEALASLGATRRELHVTAVALGNPASGRNVRVERIRAKDVVLVGDEVVFETALRHQGFAGLEGVETRLDVQWIADEEGEEVPAPPVDPDSPAGRPAGPFRLLTEEEPTPVSYTVPFEEPGTYRVTIRALLPPEAAREDSMKEDNVAEHKIRVMDEQIKVLFVDTLPRYDWRFLSNYLTREPEADPARPEHRRRYEAHVLLLSADPTVEQATSQGLRPLRKFPATRSELFQYHVIILGDVDHRRLADTAQESDEIVELIRTFVEEGGGLVFQAGEDYKNPLGYRDTPLQDLLPINLRENDQNRSARTKNIPFRVGLTEVGTFHPIFGVVPGRDSDVATPDEVARTWAGDPAYPISRDWYWYWLYRATGGLRPGAMDLARAKTAGDQPLDESFIDESGRPLVVFATMGFGKGRVFFSALDSLYRIRKNQRDLIYGPFWDQIIRYLATYGLLGGNRRFKISTDEESYYVDDTATVTITALDRDFEPLVDPFLDGVHVEHPDGTDVLLEGDDRPANQTPEGAAPGTYRMFLPIRRSGTYRIWISDPAGDGGGRAERRFEAEFRAPEKRLTLPNHDLLAQIVKVTDGMLVDGRLARLYDMDQLAADLPSRTVQRVLDRRERTQWDKPWVLLLLVGLLAVEWLVRKRWHMI